MNLKRALCVSASLVCMAVFSAGPAMAETCTGTLPGANCTLNEDTVAALTINNAVTLTVAPAAAATINLLHTIDGSATNVGAIATAGNGGTVNQTQNIGGIQTIDSIRIGDGDTWVTSADILTNNDGIDANLGSVQGDVDLGTGDGGETFVINDTVSITGQIDGHAGDNFRIGQNGAGGTFTLNSSVDSVNVDVVSGSVTAEASIGGVNVLASVVIANGATMRVNGVTSNTATLDLDGRLIISAGSTFRTATYNADANNGTFVIGLNREANITGNGTYSFTAGGPVNLNAATMEIEVASGSQVLISETIDDVIVGNTGATTLPTLVDSSFMYDFSLQQDGNNVDLIIERASLSSLTVNDNNFAVANLVLNGRTDTVNSAVQAAQLNLMNASTESAYNEVVESLMPVMNNGVEKVSSYVTDKTISLARARLIDLRSGAPDVSGVSAGDEYLYNEDEDEDNINRGRRFWVQVFGSSGEQDTRDGIDGYDVDTSGFSMGVDTGYLSEDIVLGLALSFADSKAESKDANATDTQVDTYQIALYGMVNFPNDWFYHANLGYGLNQVHNIRTNVGGAGVNARAQYDSEVITLFSEFGKDYYGSGNWIFTPSMSAKYSYTTTENYRERGAGGLNLAVSEESVHAFEVGAGFLTRWRKEFAPGNFIIPEFDVSYRYDIAGDDAKSILSLEDGGTEVTIDGFESQDHIVDTGVGVTLANQKWEAKLDYDYEWRGDYSSHTGYVRGAYKF